MAFRSQTAIGSLGLLLAMGTISAAVPLVLPVRHDHIRGGAQGELQVTESSIGFQEAGKHHNHSREWAFEDIQQVYLSPEQIQILTYEDAKWKLAQDREYKFDHLPNGAAQRFLDSVRGSIDVRRIVLAVPDLNVQPILRIKAKLLDGWGGSEGSVLIAEQAIVYSSDEPGASRTWQLRQIDNVSSSGPFDLTVTTFEQGRSAHDGKRDYRFQLKTELTEAQYNDLWRRINARK